MKRVLTILISITIISSLFYNCEQDKITIINSSSGGSETEDFSLDDFTKTVSVVFSGDDVATVTGADDGFTVDINGNGVRISYSGSEQVLYDVSGTTANGFLKIYSTAVQAVRLNSASITNPNGAAINIQGSVSDPADGHLTYIVLSGSSIVGDGSHYTNTPSGEDEKGVIFGEGAVAVAGGGALNIKAVGKSGISSDTYVHLRASGSIDISATSGHGVRSAGNITVSSGSISISTTADTKKCLSADGSVQIDGGAVTATITGNAAYDSEDQDYAGSAGVRAKGNFTMNGGTLTITNSGTGGKGINCEGTGTFNGGTVNVTVNGSDYTTGNVSAKAVRFTSNVTFAGSTVNVSCRNNEGIESKGTITVSDGIVYTYSATDDAINSAGNFTVSGGVLCAHSAGNDGIDANGNCYIRGGLVYAVGAKTPEVAIDANSEGGYKLYIEGGTVIAIGGLENSASLTQSCYSTNSWTKNAWYALTVGSNTYAFKTPSSGGSTLVVSGASTPTLKSGVSVSGGNEIFNGIISLNPSVSGGSNISLNSYSGGGFGPGW